VGRLILGCRNIRALEKTTIISLTVYVNTAILEADFHGPATLAQMVEQLIRNQQVCGSIPQGGFIFWSKSAVFTLPESAIKSSVGAYIMYNIYHRKLHLVETVVTLYGEFSPGDV
jgi:hypothetical protein